MTTKLVPTLLVPCALLLAVGFTRAADDQKPDAEPVLGHTMKTINGERVHLTEKYEGDVLLIVNTASECGYTPQYAGLQKLHEKYSGKGLRVLGFPCNQFRNQAPGSDEEIKRFCRENYGVEFDMFSKIEVNGEGAAPLYQYLTSKRLPVEDRGPIKWNFEKFLVNRDGEVVARFRSKVEPTSERMVEAIEKELEK